MEFDISKIFESMMGARATRPAPGSIRVLRAVAVLAIWVVVSVWIAAFSAVGAENPESRVNLTLEEQAFLRDHPVIRVHNETDWPPFNFFDKGKPQGFSIDYMNLLASKIGVKIQYVTGPSWNQFLEMMKSGDLDVMLNIVRTPERENFLLYTQPYAYNPNSILSLKSARYDSLGNLSGKTVAIPKGFFYEEILKRDFPLINLHLTKNVLESMIAVNFGKADAAFGELTVFNHFIAQGFFTEVVLSGEVKMGDPTYSQLNIATRKDWPELAGILEKALISITPEESGKIRSKWVSVQYQFGLDFKTILYWALPIGGTGVFIILFVVAWNRRLGHEITERKRAEEALEEAYGIIKNQKERMEEELKIGRDIQLSMIPLTFPPFPDHQEFSIFALLEPAREVGGDFYDFFFIDHHRLCFCIGDVSGKGVPAALFMAVTKTLIKSRGGDDPSTASIITHVNDKLSEENDNSMFVTVFLGILDIKTGTLTYTNAGHNPPYLKRANGDLQRLDTRHGLVIGVLNGEVYEEEMDTLEPGDLLFMYTDGVTEQMDQRGEMFSENRLAKLLNSGETNSVETAVNRTVSAVNRFRRDIEQSDDITILALRYQGAPSKELHGELNLKIQNDLSEISRVQAEVNKFCEKHGLLDKVRKKVNLVFEELLSNVISYGFQDNGDHTIDIKVELNQTRLTSTIKDDGFPFNPINVQAPDTGLPLEQRTEGGLGVHLVRNMVDDIAYQRRIDENVLTFSILNDRNA